tara:strand:+ start:22015 stop:22470 length:456 start_codon:yes stop_codon:yes gene_type:complete
MKTIYNRWKNYLMIENDADSREVAKAIIITKNNKVLILQRSAYVKKYADEWDLPGGHLKETELVEIGLDREVREETGLNISNLDHEKLMTVDNMHYYIIKYNKNNDEIDVNISDEHVDHAFISREELDNFNISDKFISAINKSMGFDDESS